MSEKAQSIIVLLYILALYTIPLKNLISAL